MYFSMSLAEPMDYKVVRKAVPMNRIQGNPDIRVFGEGPIAVGGIVLLNRHNGKALDPPYHGKVVSIINDTVRMKFWERAKKIRGLGSLKKFGERESFLKPEIAPTGRSYCKECCRRIPKGAVRYVGGSKRLHGWAWDIKVICLPCAINKVDSIYSPMKKQMASMKRRLKQYAGVGVAANANQAKITITRHTRAKGDKLLERLDRRGVGTDVPPSLGECGINLQNDKEPGVGTKKKGGG